LKGLTRFSLVKAEPRKINLIERILGELHTIAVVGLSNKPDRASYDVARYLQSKGYKIIPVNPMLTEVLGEKSYQTLLSVPEKIDIVDIFRKSDEVEPVVDEAIKIGAKIVWMQLGVVNERAAQKAKAAGLEVVMDRCLKHEHYLLNG
jgi:uncharacterized protein